MPNLSGSLVLISGSLNLNQGSIVISSGSIDIVTGGLTVSGSPVLTSNETGSLPSTGSNNFTGSQEISGSVVVTGSILNSGSFNNTGEAVISGSILISGSIVPNVGGASATSSFSLGSPTAAWKDIYVSNGTINFLNSAGQIQGTLGAGTNSTVITGSFQVKELNPLTSFTAVGGTLLHKSYTSADCAFALADSNNSFDLNPQIYNYGGYIVLPWDKKITAYSLVNNFLSINPNQPLVSLPPLFNVGYSVGDTVTVYNLGEVDAGWKNSGSIFITATVQGVTNVDTSSKAITGTFNTSYILSGSWGSYASMSFVFNATTESIKIDPGQKATFEVVFWGSPAPAGTASLSGFPEDGYSTNFTNINPSTTKTIYLFKGIENF